MKKILYSALFLTLLFINFSCKKYEEGPSVSLRSAESRLEGTWVLDRYYVNGQDETDSLMISDYKETFNKDDSFRRSFVDYNGDTTIQEATWEFAENKKVINLLIPYNNSISIIAFDILRLKNKELWYKMELNGDIYEYQLIQE